MALGAREYETYRSYKSYGSYFMNTILHVAAPAAISSQGSRSRKLRARGHEVMPSSRKEIDALAMTGREEFRSRSCPRSDCRRFLAEDLWFCWPFCREPARLPCYLSKVRRTQSWAWVASLTAPVLAGKCVACRHLSMNRTRFPGE